jgi:hypothetical protein
MGGCVSRELATDGKSWKPGLDLPRSMFMAAAAACLVASASSWEGACGGDPEFIDHTQKSL